MIHYGTTWGLGFQAVVEEPRPGRVRCDGCRRWTRRYVVQGLVGHADQDAVSRRLCDRCAKEHRQLACRTCGGSGLLDFERDERGLQVGAQEEFCPECSGDGVVVHDRG